MALGLLLLLGQPAGRMSARRRQCRGDAVGVGGGPGPRRAAGPRVPVGGQVLVELVDVERLHVGHHLVAHLPDVHVAEVNVGLPGPRGPRRALGSGPETATAGARRRAALPLPFPGLPSMQFGLGGGGGRWGALACDEGTHSGGLQTKASPGLDQVSIHLIKPTQPVHPSMAPSSTHPSIQLCIYHTSIYPSILPVLAIIHLLNQSPFGLSLLPIRPSSFLTSCSGSQPCWASQRSMAVPNSNHSHSLKHSPPPHHGCVGVRVQRGASLQPAMREKEGERGRERERERE